jgi:hypothetical protein
MEQTALYVVRRIPLSTPVYVSTLQVTAHAFGRPREDKRAGSNLPWTIDENQALMPGLREYLPEFHNMSDAEWLAYVYKSVPSIHAERVARLKGALPPSGMWPEAAAEAQVRRLESS